MLGSLLFAECRGVQFLDDVSGDTVKHFVLGIMATLAAIALSVFLVSRLGLFPIGADNPPSSLERNLASRAVNVYADNHKPAMDNPMAATPANLADGAEEYEEHCAVCHGGAAARISPMQAKFSPPVPQIVNRIPGDDDAWLFWITKHGVRMTGMPAWDGVLSDNDIWKIIAFIKNSDKLPAEVDAAWKRMATRSEDAETSEPEASEPAPAPAGAPAQATP